MSLKPLFDAGKFVVTTEVGPLKGTDITEIEEVAELLRGRVDAANVTDQQSSVMRLGSLAVSHLLKTKGIDPVFQMTCRDRNRLALQSDLLSAWVLGIENVLSITGDLPSLGDVSVDSYRTIDPADVIPQRSNGRLDMDGRTVLVFLDDFAIPEPVFQKRLPNRVG